MKTLVKYSLAAAGALSLLAIMPAASFAEMAYPEKCKSGDGHVEDGHDVR